MRRNLCQDKELVITAKNKWIEKHCYCVQPAELLRFVLLNVKVQGGWLGTRRNAIFLRDSKNMESRKNKEYCGGQ